MFVSQVPPQPGLMCQPLSVRPEWRANGFAPPPRPGFQPSPLPVISNTPRQHRQNKGRMNGRMLPHGHDHTVSYVPHVLQPSQSVTTSKYSSNQQRTGKARHVPNGGARDMKGSGVSFAVSNSVGSGYEILSSRLAAAPPARQKQILGEQLYPIVQKHKPDLAARITGMLLEMDNSELLLLLESPESLTSKVEEAVRVLKLSNAKISNQDSLHPSYPSAEVAVN